MPKGKPSGGPAGLQGGRADWAALLAGESDEAKVVPLKGKR
jgi:hypothetical protein